MLRCSLSYPKIAYRFLFRNSRGGILSGIDFMIRVKEKDVNHAIPSHHEIHSGIPYIFCPVSMIAVLGVEGEMEDERIRLGYPRVYPVKDLLDVTPDVRSIEMELIARVVTYVAYRLLRELTHSLEIQVRLILLERLVKAVTRLAEVYLIILYGYALLLRIRQVFIRQVLCQSCGKIEVPCIFKVQV